MTTLKRSASFAFGLEDVATLVDRVQVTQSAPPSPRKRSASQSSRSPSFRRAAIPRSAIQHRQPSLRRVAGEVLSATTYRAIKRQRTNPPEEWNDGWQVVTLPLETGEIVQKMVMVSKPVPQPPSPTPVQNGIVAATYRLFSTLGICRSSTPATSSAGLPHLIQPPIQVPSQDFSLNHHQDMELDVICEEEEEACVLSLVRSQTLLPPPPPSPLPAYTPLQWSLLSRYPNLINHVFSTKRQLSRNAHASFISNHCIKEANPNYQLVGPRKTSPLASNPPITLAPGVMPKPARSMEFERFVRKAQAPNAPPSPWAYYPTCSGKRPGPDGPDTLHRNAVLVNFGNWLQSKQLWVTIASGGLQLAIDWYEYSLTRDNGGDGTVTPTVTSPSASVADLSEFVFDTDMQ